MRRGDQIEMTVENALDTVPTVHGMASWCLVIVTEGRSS